MCGELRPHKLAQQIRRRRPTDFDEPVFHDQRRAAIALRVIQVRDGARGKVREDVRITKLLMAVIAAAHDALLRGIGSARREAAGALVEIARVLVKDRRKQRLAEDAAVKPIRVSRGIALAVTLGALPEAGVESLHLLSAG